MREGITIDLESVGDGELAERGDRVTVSYQMRLNRGEVIDTVDELTLTLGKREVIAGLEYGLEGMRVAGRRSFHAGPHLCYREVGVPNKIPANAVLHFDVQLLRVVKT